MSSDHIDPTPGDDSGTARKPRRSLRAVVIGALVVAAAGAAAVVAPGVANAQGCSGVAYAPPLGLEWGPVANASGGIAGSFDTFVRYNYTVSGNVGNLVRIGARGYLNNSEVWYELPPTSSSGTGKMPWGANLATPAMQAASTLTGVQVSFSCVATTSDG